MTVEERRSPREHFVVVTGSAEANRAHPLQLPPDAACRLFRLWIHHNALAHDSLGMAQNCRATRRLVAGPETPW
jgi:hypothetical protein